MEKNQLAIEVAKNLLKIKAVFLKPNDPFTWASGIKSPIYCDNRLTLSYPETRKVVEEGLAETIRKYFPTCEVVMGTSTAGIPHAAYVSEILNLPMGYVRGSAKGHGRTNQIEGRLIPGQKVVVVEDLVSTGGSAVDTVEVLRNANNNADGQVAFGYTVSNTTTWIAINDGVTVNNLTVYPMVRLASDTDNTYVPYAMTNKELTDASVTVVALNSTYVNTGTMWYAKRGKQVILNIDNLSILLYNSCSKQKPKGNDYYEKDSCSTSCCNDDAFNLHYLMSYLRRILSTSFSIDFSQS